MEAGRQGNVTVHIEGVSKTYASGNSRIHAVDNVSLTIDRGEFVCLIGPSGCGKSTLLMMVAGLVLPSLGTLKINKIPVTKPYSGLGIVFQQDLLMDWRTILKNVLVQIDIRHLGSAEFRGKALELLKLVGLSGFEDKYPHELSGGMRQRVSICRALIHDPPLLLMDEPFGALDELTREQMNLDLLKIWSRNRKTIIFVTHSIGEAVFLADKVVVMSARPGRIVETIRIDLPRPRQPVLRDTGEFTSYTRQIRDILPDFKIEEGLEPRRPSQ